MVTRRWALDLLPRHDAPSGGLAVEEASGEVPGGAAGGGRALDLDFEWYLLARGCTPAMFQLPPARAGRKLPGLAGSDARLVELRGRMGSVCQPVPLLQLSQPRLAGHDHERSVRARGSLLLLHDLHVPVPGVGPSLLAERQSLEVGGLRSVPQQLDLLVRLHRVRLLDQANRAVLDDVCGDANRGDARASLQVQLVRQVLKPVEDHLLLRRAQLHSARPQIPRRPLPLLVKRASPFQTARDENGLGHVSHCEHLGAEQPGVVHRRFCLGGGPAFPCLLRRRVRGEGRLPPPRLQLHRRQVAPSSVAPLLAPQVGPRGAAHPLPECSRLLVLPFVLLLPLLHLRLGDIAPGRHEVRRLPGVQGLAALLARVERVLDVKTEGRHDVVRLSDHPRVLAPLIQLVHTLPDILDRPCRPRVELLRRRRVEVGRV